MYSSHEKDIIAGHLFPPLHAAIQKAMGPLAL